MVTGFPNAVVGSDLDGDGDIDLSVPSDGYDNCTVSILMNLSGPYPICGDANDDGDVNVGDAVYIIAYVFTGGPPPPMMCQGDANGDGDINVGDAVYVINYVFNSGPAPIEGCCQ